MGSPPSPASSHDLPASCLPNSPSPSLSPPFPPLSPPPVVSDATSPPPFSPPSPPPPRLTSSWADSVDDGELPPLPPLASPPPSAIVIQRFFRGYLCRSRLLIYTIIRQAGYDCCHHARLYTPARPARPAIFETNSRGYLD